MEVTPEKQNIDALFAKDHYHIDFYQREYKWTSYEVGRLIEDIFYHFEQRYDQHRDLDPSMENVHGHYSWYYLNTYITNTSNGKIFVVDGQQRLTTLTLILTALYHMCSPGEYNLPERRDWLQAKITGIGVGGKKQFWMAHAKREPLMQAMFEGKEPSPALIDDGTTAGHMIENYNLIRKELGERLPTAHKLDTFVFYLLGMVVIINLNVEQTDVPMVFEVINDRGVRLQPHEILKGKLLGEINKSEVDTYADIWERALYRLEELSPTGDEPDTFFRTYLRAHFADTRKEGQKFDGPYHRAIFEDHCEETLHLQHNPQRVKEFLAGPFQYYAELFRRISELGNNQVAGFDECYFNSSLNRMDGHIMLAVAACNIKDTDEDNKIRTVARAFDRAYVMLQLNRAYDSNRFQELLFTMNPFLRGCSAEDIEPIIDQQVLAEINERRNTSAAELLSYGQFRQVGYGDYNTRFLRYLLARIEKFIADGLGTSTTDTLHNYVVGTGIYTAYHVEHILARNEESRDLFRDDAGNVDEVEFENQRNRLGGLLLLKGRDNQSSGAENYADKLATYTGNAPYLAQTLVPDFHKSNSAMKEFKKSTGLQFEGISAFDRDALERRSALLFEIVKRIWDV